MSATVKTAISIDSSTYRKVELLSRRLHVSRSQFFTQAARHMIDRSENLDLLRRINDAFAPDEGENGRLSREKSYVRRKVSTRW